MKNVEQIIEALLFASPDPLTQKKINSIFDADPPDLASLIERLQKKYNKNSNAFEILSLAGGYQIRTRSEYDFFVRRLIAKTGQFYLSQAALETLSIIAYKQPIVKSEIEKIRGVSVDYSIKKLLEKELIHIKGRSQDVGRPLLYATSDKFMHHFGLNSMKDLPKLKEFSVEENQIGDKGDDD